VAATLIAGLELARNEALTLEQGQIWREIFVHRPAVMPVEQTAAASVG
jgi:hypothetical protein